MRRHRPDRLMAAGRAVAAGLGLRSSVAPVILRGVCLLGIDFVRDPIAPRKPVLALRSRDPDTVKLAEITQEITVGQGFAAGAGWPTG